MDYLNTPAQASGAMLGETNIKRATAETDRVTAFAARVNALTARIDNATYGVRAVSNTLAGPAPETEALRQNRQEPICAYDAMEEALDRLLAAAQMLDEQTERLRSVVGI